MQNGHKIQKMIFIITLNIVVFVSVVVLSNLIYAQENRELNQKNLHEMTKHTSSNQNPHITVGKIPEAIVWHLGNIYVVNSGDDTVSVIDADNNTKVGPDIQVGDNPSAIGGGYRGI